MPYSHNQELPKGVKSHLPTHAQDIYREAFNHAWNQYKSPDQRRGEESREEISHKVAWSAVERKYRKNDEDSWVPITK